MLETDKKSYYSLAQPPETAREGEKTRVFRRLSYFGILASLERQSKGADSTPVVGTKIKNMIYYV